MEKGKDRGMIGIANKNDKMSAIRHTAWIVILCILLPAQACLSGGAESLEVWSNSRVGRIPMQVLRRAIARQRPGDITRPVFRFACAGKKLVAHTSLDQDLQAYLDSLMVDALGRMTAIVCLDPVSGRVLALAGFDKQMPRTNVWTQELVPSASIFKIVTAAGAIELMHMNPGTVFHFNGGKHTLYRYQLQNKINRHTERVSLSEAFSESINPVFGKIGALYLRKKGLLSMARRFMWGKEIPFELPVKKSTISVSDNRFSQAEVASGFNKTTRITALHGALIVGAIANSGVMMAPSFIDTIETEDGTIVYQGSIYPLGRPVHKRTAEGLFRMMKATVRKGTARKAFAGRSRDSVLKKLEIGGKTGTIDNKSHEIRYDWFCGIAREKSGVGSLAVAVIVAHQEVLGTRAGRYARLAIKRYFQDHQ